MSRVVVQLALAGGMPRPLNGHCPSLFGVWLRERIASIAIDWPAVGFHRIELLADGVRLVLLPRAATPSEAVGLAIARAVRLEVEAAALACCGLESGAALWQGHTVVIVERLKLKSGWGLGAQDDSPAKQPPAPSPQPFSLAPHPAPVYDRTLASRITASNKNTAFIDHAASIGDSISFPPIAFMICVPVR
jgi:hypothetical protein